MITEGVCHVRLTSSNKLTQNWNSAYKQIYQKKFGDP